MEEHSRQEMEEQAGESGSRGPAVHRLSSELMIMIIDLACEGESTAVYIPILSVCRRWREITTPVLWASIACSTDDASVIASSLACASDLAIEILRALTLNLHVNTRWPTKLEEQSMRPPDSAGDPDQPCWLLLANVWHQQWPKLLKSIADLAGVISSRRFSKLDTFSFRLTRKTPTGSDQQNDAGRLLSIPCSLVGDLLRSLPASVRNLEIDTGGLDASSGGPEHLCPAIRSLLPQLRHLRLRLRKLCPELLPNAGEMIQSRGKESTDESGERRDPLALQLETILLNTWSYPWERSRLCDTFLINKGVRIRLEANNPVIEGDSDKDEPLEAEVEEDKENLASQRDHTNKSLQRALIATFRSLLAEGSSLPSLKRLDIINMGLGHSLTSWIERSDLLANTKTLYPTSLVFRSQAVLGYRQLHHEIRCLRIENTGAENHFIFGPEDELEAYVDDAWLTSTTGLRMPATLNPAKILRFERALPRVQAQIAFFNYWGWDFRRLGSKQMKQMKFKPDYARMTWNMAQMHKVEARELGIF